MSTLTKEWLQQTIAELEEERNATPGAVNEDAANALAAMKLALASIEAEPVSVQDERYQHLSEIYHAQEKRLFKLAQRIKGESFDKYSHSPSQAIDVLESAIFGESAEEDSRSAMLQGAGGNSPVVPDGWVACSERMPDIDTEIFYFCQDDGLRYCGIVSSSNFSGKGDAQLYVHAEGYDLRFGVDISHWMPLPAAPQQEKSL